jgi:hypothetical protein
MDFSSMFSVGTLSSTASCCESNCVAFIYTYYIVVEKTGVFVYGYYFFVSEDGLRGDIWTT